MKCVGVVVGVGLFGVFLMPIGLFGTHHLDLVWAGVFHSSNLAVHIVTMRQSRALTPVSVVSFEFGL